MFKELENYTLQFLEQKRHGSAVRNAGLLVKNFLKVTFGNGGDENLENIVEFGLQAASLYGGSGLGNMIEKGLTYPSYLMSRPSGLNFRIGEMQLVQTAGRYDLVEVLTKTQLELRNENIRLVKPGITFTEACNYRIWDGTLFEFSLSSMPGLTPHYVGWLREVDQPNWKPGSTPRIKIVRVNHRLSENEPGQVYT